MSKFPAPPVVRAIDAAVLLLCAAGAYSLRFHLSVGPAAVPDPTQVTVLLLGVLVLFFVMQFLKLYPPPDPVTCLLLTAAAVATAAAVTNACSYLRWFRQSSRLVLFYFFALALPALSGLRLAFIARKRK